MKNKAKHSAVTCEGAVNNGALLLTISGRLDAASVTSVWSTANNLLASKSLRSIAVDGSGVAYADGAGTALLVHIRQIANRLNIPVEFSGLNADVAGMLELYPPKKLAEAEELRPRGGRDFVEQVGKAFWDSLQGLKDHIAFMGELVVGLFRALLHPTGLRPKDFMNIAEASGPQALPIVGMLGFLIGLIIAFQGANLMKQFGAEVYVADSAGLLMTRELGPLITAIIVAGRTGSAFAAELGTMKVNEEIDAFATMGLDPVRFLVIPRVMAATIMTPLLTIFANLVGIAGGAVVMMSMGYPLITYVNRVVAALSPADYLSGIFKAVIFGLLISGSGCLCGLRTGEGASAVGNSATRAVVSSIIMIVVADGIFAVLFYYLGI